MNVFCTGHRPQHLPQGAEHNVRHLFRWFFTEGAKQIGIKIDWFGSGFALGVDQWAVEEALSVRIPVLAAIPCLEQEKFWGSEAKKKYHELLSRASAVQYVSDQPYTKHCMTRRNMWMVDRASLLVAIFNGTPGGTQHCISYAIQQKARRPLPILRFDPNTQKSEWL